MFVPPRARSRRVYVHKLATGRGLRERPIYRGAGPQAELSLHNHFLSDEGVFMRAIALRVAAGIGR